MRTIAILMLMGISMAAQEPKPTPAAPKPEPPKQATLDQDKVDLLQSRLESAELRTALAARDKADIQNAYAALVTKACESLGGKSAEDCFPLKSEPGQPRVIQLKSVAVAKGDLKK